MYRSEELPELTWLTLVSIFLTIYLTSQAIYNLYFHPLSHCPGPFLAKISKLPNFYHAIKGDRHIWIWQNHQVYGDKFRVHPNQVLFLSPQAFRDIYGSKANVRRAKSYEGWNITTEGSTITTIDPHEHARKRKILSQAFTEKTVKHAAGFVIDHVERWIDLLVDAKDVGEDGWSKAKNMSDWNDWLVFDILGDLLLGRSFGLKEPGENPIRKVPHMMMKHVQMFYPVGISSFSPRIPPESQLTPKQIIQSPFVTFFIWAKPHGLDALLALVTPLEITAYFTFINDSVAQKIAQHKNRKQDDSSPKAMFDHLCAARDPSTGQPYTEDALRGEALMLIPAGSDTTSNTLSAFWFYLTSNPAAYTRLKSEIRTTFSSSSSDIVPGPRLSSCTYLHACIDETMRLDPAGPSEPPREILPGGATIDGEFYPAGTVVGCANWAMGRNERVFGDPGRFRPEREECGDDGVGACDCEDGVSG
ncbi:hypothetical protein GRF29_96g100302 [Pseudopithomyces chartarum]|uniref:Cytochrome P450 n=1 Tax=Pseudopithomyces chartarum TaxID=1892770 RepID=A0AAN6LXY3_9PLEO|nr:hypothetical protein GRF29_96g100302 [Pseudopithomyces chartarum]